VVQSTSAVPPVGCPEELPLTELLAASGVWMPHTIVACRLNRPFCCAVCCSEQRRWPHKTLSTQAASQHDLTSLWYVLCPTCEPTFPKSRRKDQRGVPLPQEHLDGLCYRLYSAAAITKR
jgi:hypothetical protein